jgi:hypothetical protein
MPLLRFAVPSGVPLSEKTTEPVGVPTADATVAVSVTVFCTNTGLGEAVSPTAGTPLFTATERVTSVAAAKFVLPDWSAATTTVPTPVTERALPLIDPGPESTLNVTASPEVLLAERVIGATP